ncbi:MAG: FAD-dependent monooxygenase, partial [Burkholderiaceae bacterium]
MCTDGLEDHRHRVVIAGGGPVGFATALGLAKQGVASVVLEADDSVCFGSRAICVSRRSLEILHRLGVGAGFDAIGLPWTGGRSFYQGQEVLRFEMPQDDNQQFAPMVNMAQYSIEQTLLDGVQANANLIDVRWQTAVTGMSQDEAGISLAVKTPTGTYQLHTDWLVAADGGRSTIREAMGLRLQGTSYEGRYVIVDILMKSPRPAERLAYFDPPCNPGSTVLVHKQPGDVWRIDYQLRDGEDPDQAILPEQVMPRVQSLLDMMGETAPWNPIWVGLYKANALTLERYRHGRVLFAGDAAHLVPILGVRGLNSGIDDADNLSWKLGQVVSGCAAPVLLDSYSSERVAATHENLSYGTKSTEFMAPPSFAFDLMRRAVLSLAVAHPELRSLINPRQSAPITYSASP